MKIDYTFLQDYINIHSPGYLIEVYNDGEVSEYAYGNKQVLPDTKETSSDTLYDIASLTKTFTSVLIYMAYEEVLIDLEQNVYDIDSNFSNLKSVEIVDLLSHNQELYTDGYLGDAKTKEEFNKILYSAFVKSEILSYVDVDYIILGYLLEKIYQKSYEQLVKEKICSPLGLTSITFFPNKEKCASSNYEYQGDILVTTNDVGVVHDKKARTAISLGLFTGHAGLFASGKDLLKFLTSFFDYSLLKKETIEMMLKHYDIDEYNYNYLKEVTGMDGDLNTLFAKAIKDNPNLNVPNTYNFMGTRYPNKINDKNDVDILLSENSVNFSGFTGPMYQIDFNKKIIVLVLCNVLHNTHLSRPERKKKTEDIIHDILKQIIK